MGSKTFESIGKKVLPGRVTIVLTSRKNHFTKNHSNPDELNKNLFFVNDLNEASELTDFLDQIESRFVVGGAKVYNQILENHSNFGLQNIFWTRIFEDFQCDTFLDKNIFEQAKQDFKFQTASKTMVDHGNINFDFVQMSKEDIRPSRFASPACWARPAKSTSTWTYSTLSAVWTRPEPTGPESELMATLAI